MSSKSVTSFEDRCERIRISATEDRKDEFGYLPYEKSSTQELKKLLKRYAPTSYADYDVAQLINEFDAIPDMDGGMMCIFWKIFRRYIYMTDRGSGVYNLYKNKLYTATKAEDMLFVRSFGKSYNPEYLPKYTQWMNDTWKKLVEIRESVRWELEPALTAQAEKEKKRAEEWKAVKEAKKVKDTKPVGGVGIKTKMSCRCANCIHPETPFDKYVVANKCKCMNCKVILTTDTSESVSKLAQIEGILDTAKFTKDEWRKLIKMVCVKSEICRISYYADSNYYEYIVHN